MILPRTADHPILTQGENDLAVAILFNGGADLRTLLLEAGILRHMNDEETSHIRDVVSEGNHHHSAKGNARCAELCCILQIDRRLIEREVFSLSRFRHFFVMHLPTIVSAQDASTSWLLEVCPSLT